MIWPWEVALLSCIMSLWSGIVVGWASWLNGSPEAEVCYVPQPWWTKPELTELMVTDNRIEIVDVWHDKPEEWSRMCRADTHVLLDDLGWRWGRSHPRACKGNAAFSISTVICTQLTLPFRTAQCLSISIRYPFPLRRSPSLQRPLRHREMQGSFQSSLCPTFSILLFFSYPPETGDAHTCVVQAKQFSRFEYFDLVDASGAQPSRQDW